MFVEDDDDLINVTIAPIIRNTAQSIRLTVEVEKYTGLMLPHPISPGVSYADYVILQQMTDRAYQESYTPLGTPHDDTTMLSTVVVEPVKFS